MKRICEVGDLVLIKNTRNLRYSLKFRPNKKVLRRWTGRIFEVLEIYSDMGCNTYYIEHNQRHIELPKSCLKVVYKR